ncbi:hypothetical protein D3C81_2063220 [compost metagenome]
MAARFSPWQPNGANNAVPSALLAMIGLAGVVYPLARSTAMPGTNCPVRATITSGKAMLSVAPRLNSGMIQTGVARPITSASRCSSPDTKAIEQPTSSTINTA